MSVEVEAQIIILVYFLLVALILGGVLVYYLVCYIRELMNRNYESLEVAKLFKFLYEKERDKNEKSSR